MTTKLMTIFSLQRFSSRLYIIRYLPRLRILDAQRVKKMERDFVRSQQSQEYEEEENGSRHHKGNALRHLYASLSTALGVRPKDPPVYHPLPESIREAGDHRGAYGKCRYRYIGAQPEGNRFILNTDL
nr:leucine-rich melanocyte differentiation-associated protein-like [Aedes albopictus]